MSVANGNEPVARKVKDKRLLRLIRRYLNAGMMQDGLVSQREAGMPQGSPLSPLLSIILSVKRAKDRIRQITHRGRGRTIRVAIEEVNCVTRGWIGYFRLASVKAPFDRLDQWIRRCLRKIVWE